MGGDGRDRRPALMIVSRVAGVVLLAGAAAACDAPSTNAPQPVADYPVSVTFFDPSSNGFRQLGYHWPLGAAIRVYADPAAQPSGWDLGDAVVAGARRWETEMYYREASVRLVASPADADVVVRYDDAPALIEYPADCSPPFIQAAGVTFFCPTDAFDAFETLPLVGGGPGHVKMEVIVSASRIADAADLRRVVAHEVGHVFGIGGHSADPGDLMYPAPEVDAPSEADGRALRYALHQPGAVVP